MNNHTLVRTTMRNMLQPAICLTRQHVKDLYNGCACSLKLAKLNCAACKQQITYLQPLLPGTQDTSSSDVPSVSWLSKGRLSRRRGSRLSSGSGSCVQLRHRVESRLSRGRGIRHSRGRRHSRIGSTSLQRSVHLDSY